MFFGLLTIGAVSYGLWTVMRGAFVLPFATIVERGIEELAKTVELETADRFRPEEGDALANHITVFGKDPLLQTVSVYNTSLSGWLDKRIDLTDSELEDLQELRQSIAEYIRFSGAALRASQVPDEEKIASISRAVQPLLTFLESFHPDRVRTECPSS